MKTKVLGDVFYVYEHWRPDKDVCFWVGKGYGGRAYVFSRNFHYDNVVKKLARQGLCVEVRIVSGGLSEAQSLVMEVERIAFWRAASVALTNQTDGGEGVSGLTHSAETRAKLSAALTGRKNGPPSEETREKIRAAQAGKLKGPNPAHAEKIRGRKHSAETKLKMSEDRKGKIFTEETRAKIRASNTGQKRSEETKAKLRESHLGNTPSDSTRQKMAQSQSAAWSSGPERREAVGKRMKELWQSPEYRAKVMASKGRVKFPPS